MVRHSKIPRHPRHSSLIHFVSLGCPRNLVDSEVMIGLLAAKNFLPTSTIEQADYIIVNTCGFLEAARQESLDVIASVIQNKKKGAKVIVTGCLAQLQSHFLDTFQSEIHYILGSGDIERIVQAVTSVERGSMITSAKSYLEQGEVPRTISTPPHYAYLKIAEGCRKACSYCIIPHIKGPLKSKAIEQIVQEFTRLISRGVFEIILIAQDLGDFGKDLGFSGNLGLIHLLKQLLQFTQDFRIRLLYVYPDEISNELIAVMKSDQRILPYLDIPIQHCNDDILHAMRRTTSKAHICNTIETLRKELPNLIIRTSLIIGFPGETDIQFNEVCQFIQDYQLDNVGIFPYSQEMLSSSALLPNHIEESVKQARCQHLSSIQHKLVLQRHQRLLGQLLPVIIDGYHQETKLLLVGRLPGQCPEIDPIVIINDFCKVRAFGEPYLVEITELSDYDLVGKTKQPIQRKEWL